MNFVIANGLVVVPVYGTPTEEAALAGLHDVFPDHKVIGVSSRGLLGCRAPPAVAPSTALPSRNPLDGNRSITRRRHSDFVWQRLAANIAKTESFVRQAAKRGAQVVLPSELFQGIYFPTRQDPKWFATALPVTEHPCVLALQKLAAELRVVIPISFFEKDGPRYYNSVAIADVDGKILGIYRKSHIPDGPGYQEKYYFRPGDTGFKAWTTRAGTIGVGICWDQWFPECARAMALAGAEVLFYPTAIGSEPYDTRSTRTRNGSARCRATRWRTPCLSLRPIASASKRTTAPSRSFMATRSSPTTAARSSRASVQRTRVCSCTRSISLSSKAIAPTGAFSATAAPISMPRASSDQALSALFNSVAK